MQRYLYYLDYHVKTEESQQSRLLYPSDLPA